MEPNLANGLAGLHVARFATTSGNMSDYRVSNGALVQIVASKQKQLICVRWKVVSTDLSHLSSTTEQEEKHYLHQSRPTFLDFFSGTHSSVGPAYPLLPIGSEYSNLFRLALAARSSRWRNVVTSLFQSDCFDSATTCLVGALR